MPPRWKTTLIAVLALGSVAGALSLKPYPQDPDYHRFADQRTFLGIPHFWNVVSNLPFVIAGAAGLALLARGGGRFHERWERGAWGVLLAAVFLVGFGSAYYHAGPTTDTLFWDRIPMTLMFSAFLAITIGERMRPAWGARLLVPLLAAGFGTLLWWRAGELRGAGDLRGYGLLQGLAMTAIPAMMLLFPPRYTRNRDMWAIVLLYAAAKACESLDAPLHQLLGVARAVQEAEVGVAVQLGVGHPLGRFGQLRRDVALPLAGPGRAVAAVGLRSAGQARSVPRAPGQHRLQLGRAADELATTHQGVRTGTVVAPSVIYGDA
jgi:hypothetical protein